MTPQARESLPGLHKAAASGDLRAVKRLLSRVSADEPDDDGWTALHWAAETGQLAAVKLLLARGADPNAESLPLDSVDVISDVMRPGREERQYKRSYDTPLRVALRGGRLRVARALIEGGADVNKRGAWGMTPLHVAAQGGPAESLQLLLSSGADVNALDEAGWTFLHWAARSSNAEAAAFLLKHRAEPNRRSTEERVMWETHWTRWVYPSRATPLHVAAIAFEHKWPPRQQPLESARLETVKALLAGGADPRAKDSEDQTPLEYAQRNWASSSLAELLGGARR